MTYRQTQWQIAMSCRVDTAMAHTLRNVCHCHCVCHTLRNDKCAMSLRNVRTFRNDMAHLSLQWQWHGMCDAMCDTHSAMTWHICHCNDNGTECVTQCVTHIPQWHGTFVIAMTMARNVWHNVWHTFRNDMAHCALCAIAHIAQWHTHIHKDGKGEYKERNDRSQWHTHTTMTYTHTCAMAHAHIDSPMKETGHDISQCVCHDLLQSHTAMTYR